MAEIGYAISSEEHMPIDIVCHAQLAEQAGFSYALISDHFHPRIDKKGHSPFVWSVIGGIARATSALHVAIPGVLRQELPMPAHFEQAAQLVTDDKVAETVVCGPDPYR